MVMIKFIKTTEQGQEADVIFNIDNGSGKVSYESLIREFECFLRACGYSFEGELVIDNTKISFDKIDIKK